MISEMDLDPEQHLRGLLTETYSPAELEVIMSILECVPNGVCGVETLVSTFPALLSARDCYPSISYADWYGDPAQDGKAAATPAQRQLILDSLAVSGFLPLRVDYSKKPTVRALIMDSNGNVLLVRRSSVGSYAGVLELPGGKIESSRLGIELLREIEEELGVTPTAQELFCINSTDKTHCFHFRVALSADAAITLSDEHDDFVWHPIDETISGPGYADYFDSTFLSHMKTLVSSK